MKLFSEAKTYLLLTSLAVLCHNGLLDSASSITDCSTRVNWLARRCLVRVTMNISFKKKKNYLVSLGLCSIQGLIPQPRIKPGPLTFRTGSLSHWTTWEVPTMDISCSVFLLRQRINWEREWLQPGVTMKLDAPYKSWVFIGRTDVEAETPILWPPDAKSWLI